MYKGIFVQYEFQGHVVTNRQEMFTDEEFDKLYKKYKKDVDNEKLIMTNDYRTQITHPMVCGSLEKINQKTITKFVKRVQKEKLDDFVLTYKYDGISLRIYIYAKSIRCITRGDVNFGTDITDKCDDIINQVKHL